MNMKAFHTFLLFFFLTVATVIASNVSPLKLDSLTSAQVFEERLKNGTIVRRIVVGNDTTYSYTLDVFDVSAMHPYGDKDKDKEFKRLQYHVKKVYPLSELAVLKIKGYNVELSKVKSKKKRRQLLRQREKELKEDFTDIIKKMTVTQGRVLVKLIDRKTGESPYDIIKEMRGGFKAFVYQGVAKLYSNDLKARYNPEVNEEDEMIERIVQMIDQGLL